MFKYDISNGGYIDNAYTVLVDMADPTAAVSTLRVQGERLLDYMEIGRAEDFVGFARYAGCYIPCHIYTHCVYRYEIVDAHTDCPVADISVAVWEEDGHTSFCAVITITAQWGGEPLEGGEAHFNSVSDFLDFIKAFFK